MTSLTNDSRPLPDRPNPRSKAMFVFLRLASASPQAYTALYDIGPFWFSGTSTDTQLNVYVSDKHYQIELSASNFEDSPTLLSEYLRHIERVDPENFKADEEEEESGDPLEDLHEWALTPFLPVFQTVFPLDRTRKYTLKDWLSAETLRYTLVIVEGKLSPSKLDPLEGRSIGASFAPSERAIYSAFPIYRPDEVRLPIDEDSRGLPAIPHKVFVSGHVQFFKLVFPGDVNSTLREFNAYTKIRSAGLDSSVRTSKLDGVVEDNGRVIGLLLSYIDSKVGTLLCVGKDPAYSSFRQKWLDQISHSLNSLHAHNILWGDAKPDNVLIDTNNDAYLIDFGGGYTVPWADGKNENKIEGDKEAFEKIRDFLLKEDDPPHSSHLP
ncbi:hypothetical protein Asppvi_003785 [Aspergillus pseudoviridinutans]|uniref:Protein kinase domain-containing protein n=1 Tax=Aspergillus pseudoviridinutans TaxID=1517512 RepID=A0A9P3B8Z5_9EURO|nr:uncharacterized protein Asppvi_003785 [Aspergillus pseudoviridinutans]GIJ84930.1 hypothetical protein Asppvi_003785 [Aspergillus pseudoviridinutans]